MSTVFVLTHETNPRRMDRALNITALALTRSLGRRGVRVVRVHPGHLETSLGSRYCAGVAVSPDLYDSEADLTAFLMSMRQRYMGIAVLMPASDEMTGYVSRHREALARVFQVIAPRWSVMQEIIDKRAQYAAAKRLGIPTAECLFPDSGNEAEVLTMRLESYPYVIKQCFTHTGRRSELQAVFAKGTGLLASDAKALKNAYRACIGRKFNDGSEGGGLMIQALIGGESARQFSFVGYLDERSRALAYCTFQQLRQRPMVKAITPDLLRAYSREAAMDFGPCTAAETCLSPVLVEQSLKLLQGIAFQGFVRVDWRFDTASDCYRLVDIHPQADEMISIAVASGVNIPYIAFIDMTTGGATPMTTWQSGIGWQHVMQDFWVAISSNYKVSARKNAPPGLFSWWYTMRHAHVHAVVAKDDLFPTIAYVGDSLSHALARMVRKLTGSVAKLLHIGSGANREDVAAHVERRQRSPNGDATSVSSAGDAPNGASVSQVPSGRFGRRRQDFTAGSAFPGGGRTPSIR